jgi:hypothetical protein
MNGLRAEQNGFRLLNVFGASKCIGETDPPASCLRINLYQMAGNRCSHVRLLGRHVDANTCAPRTSLRSCPLGRSLQALHLCRVLAKASMSRSPERQEIQKINSPVFACFANTQENEVFP